MKIQWRDRLPTPVFLGFPGVSADKESAYSVGDLGLIPGLGRSPGEGKGYSLQYSGLENSMDHGVAESRTWLSVFHFFHFWEDPPRRGNGYPLQYSCLGNARGAWRATAHGVTKQLGWLINWMTMSKGPRPPATVVALPAGTLSGHCRQVGLPPSPPNWVTLGWRVLPSLSPPAVGVWSHNEGKKK